VTISIAPGLRIAFAATLAVGLSGCCGYLVTSCPTTQAPIDSARYALSSMGSARDQANGLLQAADHAFTPAAAAPLADKYQAFGAAATVWQNDAAAVLRSSASFSVARNDSELAAVSTAARAFADSVTAIARNPANFAVLRTPLPQNAIIDDETAAQPVVGAARSFADDVANGTALMMAIAPSVIDYLSPEDRQAAAVAIENTGPPAASP
jgi:hypothetical protein